MVLNDMPDGEVRCRAAWHQWALDDVMPGETWPDVVRAWPQRRGAFRIEDPCTRCGLAWRIIDTLPGGKMDPFAVARVIYDREWVPIPQRFRRGKRRIRAELYRRRGVDDTAEQLRMAAERTEADEASVEQAIRTAPAVTFSGAS